MGTSEGAKRLGSGVGSRTIMLQKALPVDFRITSTSAVKVLRLPRARLTESV